MNRIRVPQSVLGETFAQLRSCGRGLHECVAYLVGPADAEYVVDEVVHPDHVSSVGGYQLVDRWVTRFWFDLARRQQSVRIQVHTHPGPSEHSPTDEEWALIHTSGFLSLVIPYFALGPVGLEDAHLALRRGDGGWRSVRPDSLIELVS